MTYVTWSFKAKEKEENRIPDSMQASKAMAYFSFKQRNVLYCSFGVSAEGMLISLSTTN